MSVPITALYTALLAIVMVVLAFKAGMLRGKLGIPAGAGDNAEMTLAMRRHANAAEYVPIALLLMLVLEINGINSTVLHGLGIILLISRIAHPFGIQQLMSPMRVVGAGGSTLMIVVGAVLVLWQAFS